MTQLTRSSFSKDLDVLLGAIRTADFIAIDTELTGLGLASDKLEFLDTLQERYTKLRSSASQFQLIQYGICTYHWDQNTKGYIAKPFNAFLFPRSGSNAMGLNKTFVCQASSLEFLRNHKFDFNALINDGMKDQFLIIRIVLCQSCRRRSGSKANREYQGRNYH